MARWDYKRFSNDSKTDDVIKYYLFSETITNKSVAMLGYKPTFYFLLCNYMEDPLTHVKNK